MSVTEFTVLRARPIRSIEKPTVAHVKIDPDLHRALHKAAKDNKRSFQGEIVFRLQQSMVSRETLTE